MKDNLYAAWILCRTALVVLGVVQLPRVTFKFLHAFEQFGLLEWSLVALVVAFYGVVAMWEWKSA